MALDLVHVVVVTAVDVNLIDAGAPSVTVAVVVIVSCSWRS